jgi:hypothetical protein
MSGDLSAPCQIRCHWWQDLGVARVFRQADDVRDLVADQFGSARRLAGTDFPNRAWMLDLADWNVTKALAECAVDRRDP